jgi:hypothetical protein
MRNEMNIDWDNILVDENPNKLFDIFLDKFNLAKQKSIPKINSKKVSKAKKHNYLPLDEQTVKKIGSKLLSITMQLHCGGHLGRRAQLPNTILQEDHPMTIPSKFGFNSQYVYTILSMYFLLTWSLLKLEMSVINCLGLHYYKSKSAQFFTKYDSVYIWLNFAKWFQRRWKCNS